MVLGADSAAYTGVVDDFAPTAKPSAKRAINRLTQLEDVSGWMATQSALDSLVCCGHPDASDERDNAGDEYRAAASEVVIERCITPATNECRAEIRRTVKQTLDPNIRDAKLVKVEQLRAVDRRLVHALNNGGPSTEYDQKVEHEWLRPSVRLLIPEDGPLFLGQLADILVSIVSLAHARDERTLSKSILVFSETSLKTPLINISNDLFFTKASEGVAQPSSDRCLTASLFLVAKVGGICICVLPVVGGVKVRLAAVARQRHIRVGSLDVGVSFRHVEILEGDANYTSSPAAMARRLIYVGSTPQLSPMHNRRKLWTILQKG